MPFTGTAPSPIHRNHRMQVTYCRPPLAPYLIARPGHYVTFLPPDVLPSRPRSCSVTLIVDTTIDDVSLPCPLPWTFVRGLLPCF